MYHVFNGTAPQYLAEFCQVCSDGRLRSALQQDYVVPRSTNIQQIRVDALRSRCGHYILQLWLPSSFFLWPPIGIGHAIIFLPCGFYLSIFFFFPRLISAVADWMSIPYLDTWCGPSANLQCRYEICCTRLAENTGRKKSPKIAIWAPSHNFVWLYLRN